MKNTNPKKIMTEKIKEEEKNPLFQIQLFQGYVTCLNI